MEPTYRSRFYLLTAVVLAGCGVLLARLHEFQIDRRDEFRKLVPGSHTVTVREPGVRGEITDRNGIALARNRRNYVVTFNLEEIYKAWKRRRAPANHDTTIPATPKKAESAEPSIDQIVNTEVIPKLKEFGLAKNYSSRALRVHFLTHRGLVPFTYRTDLTYDQFAALAEHNLDLPGVEVAVRPEREYPYGALASHVIGYVRQWKPGDIPERAKHEFDHYTGDEQGDMGVEATMDAYLRGPEGVRKVLYNEKGRPVGLVDYRKPGIGARVELTIDARKQYFVENVLRQAGRAAAVVVEADTGAIVAMASVPDYDPNRYIPSISSAELEAYAKNPCAPMLDRAIIGFAPGSTFKIATAISGALAGMADRHITCNGYVAYGNHKVGCWIYNMYGGSHGTLDLSEALQRSCNPYFCLLSNMMGAKAMVRGFGMLGFGQRTGIRLPAEDPGILPGSKRWLTKLRPGHAFTPALVAMLSIGQGDASATPLQMASMVAAVANGGRYYAPRIVRRVVHPEQGVLVKDVPRLRVDLLREGVEPADLEKIRHGMWMAVNKSGGTAGRARLDDVEVAGKTGTAQTTDFGKKSHNAWTVAFAPYDAPKYAVAVMVQNGGSGGKVAGALVHIILQGLFAADAGQHLPLRRLREVPGNIDEIEEIPLPEDATAALEIGDAGETGEEATPSGLPPLPPNLAPDPPEPTITPPVDEGGTVIPKAIPIE